MPVKKPRQHKDKWNQHILLIYIATQHYSIQNFTDLINFTAPTRIIVLSLLMISPPTYIP